MGAGVLFGGELFKFGGFKARLAVLRVVNPELSHDFSFSFSLRAHCIIFNEGCQEFFQNNFDVLGGVHSFSTLPGGTHFCIIIYENRVLVGADLMFGRAILHTVKLRDARKVLTYPIKFRTANFLVVFARAVLSCPSNNADNNTKSIEVLQERVEVKHIVQRFAFGVCGHVLVLKPREPIPHTVEVIDGAVHVKVNRLHVFPFSVGYMIQENKRKVKNFLGDLHIFFTNAHNISPFFAARKKAVWLFRPKWERPAEAGRGAEMGWTGYTRRYAVRFLSVVTFSKSPRAIAFVMTATAFWGVVTVPMCSTSQEQVMTSPLSTASATSRAVASFAMAVLFTVGAFGFSNCASILPRTAQASSTSGRLSSDSSRRAMARAFLRVISFLLIGHLSFRGASLPFPI